MGWSILGAYVAVSGVTLGFYGWDKFQAGRNRWRVRERTLHLLELFGGWPGGLVGQTLFRHKRRKTRYLVVFWAIVAVHAVGWMLWWRR